ncbi:MAG: GNAT family N-acetyltransferase [Gammaproteobacteria bacterium]|nr:GNAT family N-acetyltransferase [Gammaproteobacteria bacterium]
MPKIIIDEVAPEKIKELLINDFRDYNTHYFGKYKLEKFAFYINNDASEMIAGLYGFVLKKYSTVRIEFLFVKEVYRNQGVGKQLLEQLKKYAHDKNCNKIQVSTMEFQGPQFYEKNDYERIGIIPKWFCDKDEIFFEKKL